MNGEKIQFLAKPIIFTPPFCFNDIILETH